MIVKSLGYLRGGAEAAQALQAHIKYLIYRARGDSEPKRQLFAVSGVVTGRLAAVAGITEQFGTGIAYHKLVLSPSAKERQGIEARGAEGWQEWTPLSRTENMNKRREKKRRKEEKKSRGNEEVPERLT